MDAAAQADGDRPGRDERVPQRRRAGGPVRPPPRPAVGGAAGAQPPPRRHRARPEHARAAAAAHAWLGRNGGRLRLRPALLLGAVALGLPARVRRRRPRRRAAAAPPVAGTLPDWVPAPFRGLVTSAALGAGLPPVLLAALLRSESGFDPRAVSPAGAQGIAQFMPATARGLGLRDPFDLGEAIPAAARLLAGHLRAFGSVPAGAGGLQRRTGRGRALRGSAAVPGDPGLRGADPGPGRRGRGPRREAPPATASPSCAPAIDSSESRGILTP